MRKASGKLFCWTQFFSEFFKVVFFFFFAEFLIHLRSACFHEGTRLGGKVVVSPNTKPQQQQHKTQQQQHKTTTTTTKHSEMESFFQLVATRGRDFLQKEIPELLQLLSQSLSKKPPIPLSFAEGSRMSMEDWLSLTPLLTVSLYFSFLFSFSFFLFLFFLFFLFFFFFFLFFFFFFSFFFSFFFFVFLPLPLFSPNEMNYRSLPSLLSGSFTLFFLVLFLVLLPSLSSFPKNAPTTSLEFSY